LNHLWVGTTKPHTSCGQGANSGDRDRQEGGSEVRMVKGVRGRIYELRARYDLMGEEERGRDCYI